MGNSLNKLLLRQIKRHFGTIDHLPDEMRGIIQDISNTYANFEDDIKLLQNSIEISSQELRDGLMKQKSDAEAQKATINNIGCTNNTNPNNTTTNPDSSDNDKHTLFPGTSNPTYAYCQPANYDHAPVHTSRDIIHQ